MKSARIDLDEFLHLSCQEKTRELDRVARVLYYNYRANGLRTQSLREILSALETAGFPKPNSSRLVKNMKRDSQFVTSDSGKSFRLHPNTIRALDDNYRELLEGEPLKVGTSLSYVHQSRISDLQEIESDLDTSKLQRLCTELNSAFFHGNLFSVGILVRAILDHVPPFFGERSFSNVANHYPGGRSFSQAMKKLDEISRKIADSFLHQPARRRESLPTVRQVDFTNEMDVLLAELIRVADKR